MNKLFVDTAGWIALINRSDAVHTAATKIYNERFAAGWEFITHAGVMLEVGNGMSLVRFRHLAVRLNTRIDASAHIEVVPLSEALYRAGWQMYAKRLDKDWGLVDCISFVVMQERGLIEALTADRHFQQAGFTMLL
ncbi:MAG: type II toxin-antitoxin system VapC family toxin [Gammaproteobacteria bacterium]